MLYLATPTMTSAELEAKLTALPNAKLEQLDRLLNLTLPENWVSQILSDGGYFHSDDMLKVFKKTLTLNGTLVFVEPIYKNTVKGHLPYRTLRELQSELSLNGFIDIVTVPLSTVNSSLEFIPEEMEWIQVTCKTPSYSTGSVAKLSFAKKPTSKPIVSSMSWKEKVDQESQGLVGLRLNDDSLLDADDLIKPILSTDCSTKKKACKNCSCGRAQEEANQVILNLDELVTIVNPKKTSSCGSCYLGDAFRCASCPYLGMPAFTPGQTVSLVGNMLNDDI